MNNTLKQIIEKKQKDLGQTKQNKFLNFSINKIAIIAEIKLASPTIPYLGVEKEIEKRAIAYEKAGANTISIITEKHFFKGHTNFISRIKKVVNIPILVKDFVIGPIQIYEAKINGGNAILLIARLVDKNTLKKFVDIAKQIGIEPIVEINNAEDLQKALASSTTYIAVNARNLETFVVDVDQACRLMEKIPNKFIKLGFSGIKSSSEVSKYEQAGAKGVLVGTSLMKAQNIKSFINELTIPKTKVKICGIRTLESAQTAVDAGADFLGFNFVPTSKRYIKPELAKKIISQLKIKVKIVGVFQNAKLDYVNSIIKLLNLDFVQLHEKRIIKSTKDKLTYLLIDRKIQGVGQTPNLNEVKNLSKSSKIFFAGGLTPENVESIIKKIHPFAIDVAGGIETNGIQDNEKIKEFIEKVKGVRI